MIHSLTRLYYWIFEWILQWRMVGFENLEPYLCQEISFKFLYFIYSVRFEADGILVDYIYINSEIEKGFKIGDFLICFPSKSALRFIPFWIWVREGPSKFKFVWLPSFFEVRPFHISQKESCEFVLLPSVLQATSLSKKFPSLS